MIERIVISSGHSRHVRGAQGVLEEVWEARKVVERVAGELEARGIIVATFHDNDALEQSENLKNIVAFHNAQVRDLDVSVHFNAYVETNEPMGTECLYVTQDGLAKAVSAAIANCGFKNRGPKQRTDLYFLNNTDAPAILIEVCFVDSQADAEIYEQNFDRICTSIVEALVDA